MQKRKIKVGFKRYYAPVRILFLIGILCHASLWAESEQDHNGLRSSKTTPDVNSALNAAPPQKTRQELLVEGLRNSQLSKPVLAEIVKTTENSPKLTTEQFKDFVDKLVETPLFSVSEEQAQELKDLYNEVFQAVENQAAQTDDIDAPATGKELNVAAKQVLESDADSEQGAAQANNQPNASPAITPNDPLPFQALGQSDLAKQLDAGASKQPAPESEEEVAKKLELADQLVKKLGNLQQQGSGKEDNSSTRDLLGILRGALGDLEKDKEDKKGDDGDLGKALDSALNKHSETPPPPPESSDDEGDSKLADLLSGLNEEPKEQAKNDTGGGGDFSSDSKSSDDGKKEEKKQEEPLDLTGSSESEDEELVEDEEPKETGLEKFLAEEEPEPEFDPSSLLADLQKTSAEPPAKSSLDPIGASAGSGGFGGGGFFGGGGGAQGPPIVGGGSALPSSGFPGDPFSSVGRADYGGGGGGYQLSKSVDFGSATGSGYGDTGEDTGNANLAVATPKNKLLAGAFPIVLPGQEGPALGASITGSPLLDYIGNIGKTLCEPTRTELVGVCQKSRTIRKAPY